MEEIAVIIVHGIDDEDGIEDYVLSAFSTVRDATVEEMVGIYNRRVVKSVKTESRRGSARMLPLVRLIYKE